MKFVQYFPNQLFYASSLKRRIWEFDVKEKNSFMLHEIDIKNNINFNLQGM